jgi:hypothetical protein
MNPVPALFAQTEATTSTEPAAHTPEGIPHGKFLLDYALVLALLAGAIYAVCRSSRRV